MPTINDKLVFSHYFTPYPISWDNRTPLDLGGTGDTYDIAWLSPSGENGKHAAYGGLLRDRPIPRQPLPTTSDYRIVDNQTEIRQAKAIGLDGFTMDLLFGDGHPDRQLRMMQAADAVGGFWIFLQPDGNSWNANISSKFGFNTEDQIVAEAARRLKVLGAYNSAFRLDDGRLVVSPFYAERWTPARWQAICDKVLADTGKGVAFIPCFLSYGSNISAFVSGMPSLIGATTWGNRSPAGQSTTVSSGQNAKSRGLLWMHPVSVQDERPDQFVYDEAWNTQNLRDSWAGATTTGANWVHIPTWNDYSEGAQLAPSKYHGWTFANLCAYYIAQWKTGSPPPATKDQLFLTHRRQPYNATPTGGQTKLMGLRGGSSSPRNTVEVVSILTAPGTVTINVGGAVYTQSRAAGLDVGTTVPLDVGTISATLSRTGSPDLVVRSPAASAATLPVQDLQYVAATAARSATTVPQLFGINDAAKPTGMLDTLEGAWSSGAGTGIGNRVPVVHVINGWTAVPTAFASGSRELALFNAGHDMLVSFRGSALYTDVINGGNDAAIDALGDRIYALGWGAAVSGTQPGQTYGGTKPSLIRISFQPQMDTNTTAGTADQFKQAYRRFMGRIKARKPSGAPERIRCVPIFSGGAATSTTGTQYWPGNTAADYADEVGVNSFNQVSSWKSFADLFAGWHTWSATNAGARKVFVAQTGTHPDPANSARQGAWITDMANTLLSDSRFAGGCWWSPDNYTTTPDDRVVAKSINASLFTAFHDAVAAVIAAGQPTADVTPPAVPTGLSAPTITSTSVTLTWNQPPDPDIASYQLMRDNVVIASPASANATSYTVSGQTPQTSHTYRVAAVDTSGNVSAFSTPITVAHPAVASFDPPSITGANVTMNGLTANATATVVDPAGGAVVLIWNWGDGDASTDSPQTHTYATDGVYSVLLSATSSISGLTASQTINVVATADGTSVTDYLGLWQPVPGQPVGLFGPRLRENNNRLDDVIQKFDQRKVQSGNGPLIANAPIVSYAGTLSVAFEAPTTDYPDGRIIVTGT